MNWAKFIYRRNLLNKFFVQHLRRTPFEVKGNIGTKQVKRRQSKEK